MEVGSRQRFSGFSRNSALAEDPGKYRHEAPVLKLHTFGGTWPKPVIQPAGRPTRWRVERVFSCVTRVPRSYSYSVSWYSYSCSIASTDRSIRWIRARARVPAYAWVRVPAMAINRDSSATHFHDLRQFEAQNSPVSRVNWSGTRVTPVTYLPCVRVCSPRPAQAARLATRGSCVLVEFCR